MSAVLRAYGSDFEVDAFLLGCALPVCAVQRKGEPKFPATQPDGKRLDKSGVNVSVSGADFDDLPGQVNDAIDFLEAQAEQIRRLCEWPGVEDVSLDFGIERRDVAVQCDALPPQLLRLAGLLGLWIEISQYPFSCEKDD